MRRIQSLLVGVALLGCGGASPTGALPVAPAVVRTAPVEAARPAISEAFGLDAPLLLQDASIEHAWVAACFLLSDTNRDGALDMGTFSFSGDEPRPFLLLNGRAPEPIEQYLGSSGDRKFVAILQAQRIWLIDVVTQRRIDLTALGADLGVDDDPYGPPPAISFSRVRPHAVFVRRSPGVSEVISIELPSGNLRSLYATTDNVLRTDFPSDEDVLRVWLAPSEEADFNPSGVRYLKRPCQERAPSCRPYEPERAIPLALPPAEMPPFLPEAVGGIFGYGGRACDEGGRAALASAPDDRHLLARSLLDAGAQGPLWWFRGQVAETHCPPAPTESDWTLRFLDQLERSSAPEASP